MRLKKIPLRVKIFLRRMKMKVMCCEMCFLAVISPLSVTTVIIKCLIFNKYDR